MTSTATARNPPQGFDADLAAPLTAAAVKSYSDFSFAKTRSNEAVVGGSNRVASSFLSSTPSDTSGSRPRSSSAGRTRTAGTDIVQEIYDRLGITRGAFFDAGSVDPKSQNQSGRFTAANYSMTATSSKHGSERGRPIATTADIACIQRPRSLSRGRQFRSLWPPSESSAISAFSTVSAPKSPSRNTDAGGDPLLSPKPQRGAQSSEVPGSFLSPKPRIFRNAPTENGDALSPKSNSSQRNNIISQRHDSKQYDGPVDGVMKESQANAANDGECFINGSSVKERMRAFSEPTTKSKKLSDTPKRPPVERNYPPLIDIFAEERVRQGSADMAEEKKDDDIDNYSIIKQVQKQQFTKQTPDAEAIPISPISSREKGSVLANAFLAAIQTSAEKVPSSPRNIYSCPRVPDVNGDDQGSVPDTVSVSILSSVGSHDEHNNLSPLNQQKGNSSLGVSHSRKPSWLDSRSKRSSGSGKIGASVPSSNPNPFLPKTVNGGNGDHSSQPASTSAIIERLVDERVQARVAELERRMEDQMRTYMQELEAKMTSRLTLPSGKRESLP
jgi:hypothetical protein